MEHEFDIIRKTKTWEVQTTNISLDNEAKNFSSALVPFDNNIVQLSEIYSIPGSNYINASHINAYNIQNGFIATQSPMNNTMHAFWKMCYEQNASTIICLDEKFDYFPTEPSGENSNKVFSEGGVTFTISCLSHSYFEDYEFLCPVPRHESFVIRTLKLVSSLDKNNPIEILHFQLNSWETESSVSEEMKLVNMLLAVERVSEHLVGAVDYEPRPNIVHCTGGCGQTGIFLTLANSVERVKAEGTVDIFQTVKLLRQQRPHMVQTLVSEASFF